MFLRGIYSHLCVKEDSVSPMSLILAGQSELRERLK